VLRASVNRGSAVVRRKRRRLSSASDDELGRSKAAMREQQDQTI
jgi:hypothetical protein